MTLVLQGSGGKLKSTVQHHIEVVQVTDLLHGSENLEAGVQVTLYLDSSRSLQHTGFRRPECLHGTGDQNVNATQVTGYVNTVLQVTGLSKRL